MEAHDAVRRQRNVMLGGVPMAMSKCAACKGSYFEVVTKEPRGANYKINFVQCTGCGAVVGVMEFFNAGKLLSNLSKEVAELKRDLAYVYEEVGRVRRKLG
jgi:hypothetical protein